MNGIGAILVGSCAIFICGFYWQRLLETSGVRLPVSFRAWAIRGALAPWVLLAFFTSGLFQNFPPLVEHVSLLYKIKNWWIAYLALQTVAFGIVATYFCAVTLLWLAGVIGVEAESKMEFFMSSLFWGALTLPFCGFIVWVNGWPALGAGASAVLAAIVANTSNLLVVEAPVLNYSAAEASIKFGRYDQAEVSIIQQLEKEPADFEGWMKLAELYAKNFKDLSLADQTIRDLVEQPQLSPTQISLALETLADWHLNLARNPYAAQSALKLLCQRLAGTHFAKMAEIELGKMPKDETELREREQRRKIRLPALREEPGEVEVAREHVSAGDAVQQANRCVELLTRNPNDVAARERFALVLAEQLEKPAAGIDQLRLLMDVPGLAEGKKAEALSMIAAWQLKYLSDKTAAAETCRRIMKEHPQSAAAFAAQRRLNLMEMEDRFARARAAQVEAPRIVLRVEPERADAPG